MRRRQPRTYDLEMTRLRSHLPSAIVATFVLVVAMAASATAATLITSAQIKDNTIASVDIHDGTVKSVDLANGGVAGIDVKDSSIASVDIANGSVQPADLSQSARTALAGAACTVPGFGAGVVALTVLSNGTISFKCVNAATTDHDGDSFSVAEADCNDTDPEIFPGALEALNGIDDDCDGLLATGVSFYTGPAETEGIGACQAGIKDETESDPFFVVIVDEVTPIQEIGGNGIDDDCDGIIDPA